MLKALSASSKPKKTKDRLSQASLELRNLFQKRAEYSVSYFSEQWQSQRSCQLGVMADGSSHRLEQRLATLLDLQEKLHEAQWVFFVFSLYM